MRAVMQLEEKSPVKGDLHAGICGSRGVRFPSATRLPIGNSGPALEQIAEAKAVCARCLVVVECRTDALASPRLTEHGVFGGMSEDERRAELRRRRRRGDASGVAA